MPHPDFQLPDQYKMETLDKIPMEDKLILSREEDYAVVSELTPGEISRIVNKALRDLPAHLSEGNSYETIKELCFQVAHTVMNQMIE